MAKSWRSITFDLRSSIMSPTVQDKTPGKPRSRKVVQRSKKRDQTQTPKLSPEDQEQIGEVMAAAPAHGGEIDEMALAATVVSAMNEPPPELEAESASDEAFVVDEAVPELAAAPALDEPVALEAAPLRPDAEAVAGAATAADDAPQAASVPTGARTFSEDYRNYVSGSVSRAGFLFEKLMAARSLDQAMEVQAEFAKQPYANVFEGTQLAFKLYGDFTKRILTTWQRSAPGK
jgi:hypothetical protein